MTLNYLSTSEQLHLNKRTKEISNFGSLVYTVNGVFIFIGYNLLRTIYDDNFEPDVEVQIDGNMFQGMRGRVMFSKVSRAYQVPRRLILCDVIFQTGPKTKYKPPWVRPVREGRGGAVGWQLPPPAFCRFRSTPFLDRLSSLSNLSTFLKVPYRLFHLLYIQREKK